MCLERYDLDHAKFFSVLKLAWRAASGKLKGKLNHLTDIDMSITVEKSIRRGICHSIYQYEKVNNKCMKDYNKNKESS